MIKTKAQILYITNRYKGRSILIGEIAQLIARMFQQDQEVVVGRLDSLHINFGISQSLNKSETILTHPLEIFLILEWAVMKQLGKSVRLSRFQIC